MIIKQPGIYDISNDVYHACPCETASLSRSIATVLLDKTPAHARLLHPKLNPDFRPDNKTAYDKGNAGHDLLLFGGKNLDVLGFADWRTKVAREAREASLSLGRFPIKEEDHAEAVKMVAALRKQIAAHQESPDGFSNGKPEQSIIWQEQGVWLRAKPDWLGNDGWLDDYKTSGITSPGNWINGVMADKGYDLQAAMALRGYAAVTGKQAKGFRFFVQEVEPPYCMFVVFLTNMALDDANEKLDEAIELWAWCLQNDQWPGYMAVNYHADLPMRAQYRWADRQNAKKSMAMDGKDMREFMLKMYAPLEKSHV